MKHLGWKVSVSYEDYAFFEALSLRIYRWQDGTLETLSIGDGGHFISTRHENAEGARWPDESSIKVPKEILQAMMDGLWQHGIRPEDRRFDNEMKLMREWLDDMRSLVFGRKESGNDQQE